MDGQFTLLVCMRTRMYLDTLYIQNLSKLRWILEVFLNTVPWVFVLAARKLIFCKSTLYDPSWIWIHLTAAKLQSAVLMFDPFKDVNINGVKPILSIDGANKNPEHWCPVASPQNTAECLKYQQKQQTSIVIYRNITCSLSVQSSATRQKKTQIWHLSCWHSTFTSAGFLWRHCIPSWGAGKASTPPTATSSLRVLPPMQPLAVARYPNSQSLGHVARSHHRPTKGHWNNGGFEVSTIPEAGGMEIVETIEIIHFLLVEGQGKGK